MSKSSSVSSTGFGFRLGVKMSLDRNPHALALTGKVSEPLHCLLNLELLVQAEENS